MRNRTFTRKLKEGEDEINKIILRKLKRKLLKAGIDYLEKDGEIYSNRKQDVQHLYDQTMKEIYTQLQMLGGDYKKLKRIHSNKK
jgi:hypothetical protein